MMLSVLLTTYNCEAYVDAAIKSVICQNKPFDWELLIGDDGSTDRTQERIKEWIIQFPNHIKLYVMERNNIESKNGTRAARNRANLLSKAKGKYLIFLDGDDQYLGTEKLQTQVKILESDYEKKYSGIAHNIIANDLSSGKKYALTDPSFNDGCINSNSYWEEMYFHTNTIMFRNCCVEMMLNEKYRDYLNDNFITYIILQYGSLYYLHNEWAQYNLTGSGLWTGKKRTYGCFRNLIIFDLQKEINSNFSKASLIRHLYDFRYIFKYYSIDDREYIDVLLDDLNPERFHYTFLMYKLGNELSTKEKLEKISLYLKIISIQNNRRITKLVKKLNRGGEK